MEFVLKALEGIFSIVFIIGIGFVLSRRGWFDEYSSALIARLVTAVSLPLYMIVSISKNFDHNKLVAMAPDLLLPICSMLLAFIVGKLAARIFKIKKERRGIFCTNFFIANTMFIGLPVNLALFGEKSIPAVMLYYMVNTTFFWTLGVHNIVQDTLAHTNNKLAFFSPTALKKIFSPPLSTVIAGNHAVSAGLYHAGDDAGYDADGDRSENLWRRFCLCGDAELFNGAAGDYCSACVYDFSQSLFIGEE